MEPLIKDTLNKGKNSLHFEVPSTVVHFNLRREDNLSIKDKMAHPNVSTIRRYTIVVVATG